MEGHGIKGRSYMTGVLHWYLNFVQYGDASVSVCMSPHSLSFCTVPWCKIVISNHLKFKLLILSMNTLQRVERSRDMNATYDGPYVGPEFKVL